MRAASPPFLPCETCGLVDLCRLSQVENYRLQAVIYPFALAECEHQFDLVTGAPTLPARPKERDESQRALIAAVLALLEASDVPLTAVAIRLGLNLPQREHWRIYKALRTLEARDRALVVGCATDRPGPPLLWEPTGVASRTGAFRRPLHEPCAG